MGGLDNRVSLRGLLTSWKRDELWRLKISQKSQTRWRWFICGARSMACIYVIRKTLLRASTRNHCNERHGDIGPELWITLFVLLYPHLWRGSMRMLLDINEKVTRTYPVFVSVCDVGLIISLPSSLESLAM